ncbi:DMT family transporter [Inediibacterium massiliense]|uniref:DMT family transporter n=1 Tax=Inediibacterium massiliense TaxID=1658111 RepID=UPI0006B44F4B|nr:DMT family transporter [Inediibacterium massiliense]
MKNHALKGSILVILSTFAFGAIPVISQLALHENLNIPTVLFFRFFIASCITWTYIFTKKLNYKIDLSHFFYLGILSIVGFLGTAYFIYVAYTYISGSLATIILFTHPAMISCYEFFVMKTSRDIRKILALICATIGMILVVWSPNIELNILGVIFSLLSAICYSFYALGLNEKRTRKLNSIVISGYVSFFCSISYFIVGLFKHTIFIPTTTNGWIYILILATFSTVFATITFCKGIQLIGPSTAVIISTFEPVVACVSGFFILDEVLTLPMIIGGVLILSAIFILQIPQKNIYKFFHIKIKENL